MLALLLALQLIGGAETPIHPHSSGDQWHARVALADPGPSAWYAWAEGSDIWVLPPVSALQPVRANLTTAGLQIEPELAVDPVTAYTFVVWSDTEPYPSLAAVRGRVFPPYSPPFGVEYLTHLSTPAFRPLIQPARTGGWAVASTVLADGQPWLTTWNDPWTVTYQDVVCNGAVWQSEWQAHPALCELADGEWLVVWEEYSPQAAGTFKVPALAGRIINASGQPTGMPFALSTRNEEQRQPRLASRRLGAVVLIGLVWQNSWPEGEPYLRTYVYNAAQGLVSLTGDIRVPASPGGLQRGGDLAISDMGVNSTVLAVWEDVPSNTIRAREFSARGKPLTGDMQANTYALGPMSLGPLGERSPDVCWADWEEYWILTWHGESQAAWGGVDAFTRLVQVP